MPPPKIKRMSVSAVNRGLSERASHQIGMPSALAIPEGSGYGDPRLIQQDGLCRLVEPIHSVEFARTPYRYDAQSGQDSQGHLTVSPVLCLADQTSLLSDACRYPVPTPSYQCGKPGALEAFLLAGQRGFEPRFLVLETSVLNH